MLTNTANGQAKIMAENMLTAAFGKEYCNCIDELEGALYGFHTFGNENEDVMEESEWFNVSPNPATTWISFTYQNSTDTPTSVLITNENGKQIQAFQFSEKIGQKVWDVRALKSGTYLYTFIAGSTAKSGKIVIK